MNPWAPPSALIGSIEAGQRLYCSLCKAAAVEGSCLGLVQGPLARRDSETLCRSRARSALLKNVEKSFNFSRQFFRLCRGSVTHYNAPFSVDEEFGEVPFDSSGAEDAENSGFAPLEELIQRVSTWAVHFDLGKDWKADAIVSLAELTNLRFGARFLGSKLVAGKSQHAEAALPVRTVELF